MTLAAADAVTETLSPVPTQADTSRTAIRPVFVDDGGRRKRLLVRAGYLAVASFIAYVMVIGLSLTALPSGPLAGIGSVTVAATPSHGSARSAAPTERRVAAVDPDVDPAVVPTPAAVRLLAAPAPIRRVRPSTSRAPLDRAAAPSPRPREADGEPTTTSKAAPLTTSSSPPSTTKHLTTAPTSATAR